MIVAASFDLADTAQWYNRALQYGDGLFETMRFSAGRIPLWAFHQNRMTAGLSKLGMADLNWSEVHRHIKKVQDSSCLIKLLAFRSGQQRGYQASCTETHWLISTHPLIPDSKLRTLKLGVAQGRLAKQPLLAGIKHLNRLEQVLIANELNQMSGIDDLLVLDQRGRVIETTCKNVVFLKNGQLFTPKLKHCGVKGVALSWLKSNYLIKSKHIPVKSISDYDGLMVANSIRGFQLVEQVIGCDETHSFFTKHLIHDKISTRWELMFDS